MLILIPILTPAAAQFGIDPIQFGLIFVLNLMIGTITPPVGVVLFVTAKVANISFEAMSRAILPWLIPLLACWSPSRSGRHSPPSCPSW